MSENITKHYQELFCIVICKIFIFKSCGRWMKTWPPVACPAPWAEETWLLLPGRGSRVAHSQTFCGYSHERLSASCGGGQGDLSALGCLAAASPGLHLLDNSSSQSSSSPSAFQPLLPLSGSPLPTGTCRVQSPQLSSGFTTSLPPPPPASPAWLSPAPSQAPDVSASRQYSQMAHKEILSWDILTLRLHLWYPLSFYLCRHQSHKTRFSQTKLFLKPRI